VLPEQDKFMALLVDPFFRHGGEFLGEPRVRDWLVVVIFRIPVRETAAAGDGELSTPAMN
jgi:hypothetical protein